ncbi:MAG: two pore domain potassium channel family protein [Sphingobacteriales bacterium]|nr:MAG: two pore domain potassium channel family protein [Sphingobacteriales bacterium]
MVCHLILEAQLLKRNKIIVVKKHLSKILKGNNQTSEEANWGYKLHIKQIGNVWHSKKYNDFGLERLFRLTISALMFIYPGILIETILNSKTYLNRKLAAEFYIVFKTLFPLFILVNGWYNNGFIYYLNIYLLTETYVYLFSKIFLAEHHAKTSNKRTLLLLIFNFIESGLSFAVIYMAGNYLNAPLNSAVDAIYFSTVTSATVGYGDYYPITQLGKLITLSQVLCSVAFIVLFFNFFSGATTQKTEESMVDS